MSISIRHDVATIAALSLFLVVGCGAPSAPSPQLLFVAKTDGDVASRFNRIHELEARLKQRNVVDLVQYRQELLAYCDAVIATAESIMTDPKTPEVRKMQALDFTFKALAQRSEAAPGEAQAKLSELVDLIESRGHGTMLATLAAYNHVQGLESADERIFSKPEDRDKALDTAMRKLAAANPPHPDTPRTLEQLALRAEKAKDTQRARIIYTLLADEFPDDPFGARAKRALYRLDLMGKVVQDIHGVDPDGKPIDLKDFRGRPVLVFFWSGATEPLQNELEMMLGGMTRYDESQVARIGVNMDGGADKARSFARKTKLHWPQIVSPLETNSAEKPVPELAARFGIAAPPYHLVIDREGRLVASGVGFQSIEPALRDLVRSETTASKEPAK